MKLFDRFEILDDGFSCILPALVFKAQPLEITTPEIALHKSQSFYDRSPSDVIDDLTDQICDIAHNCGLSAKIKITYTTECRSCGKEYEIDCDLHKFDQSMSYCGGSQYCLP